MLMAAGLVVELRGFFGDWHIRRKGEGWGGLMQAMLRIDEASKCEQFAARYEQTLHCLCGVWGNGGSGAPSGDLEVGGVFAPPMGMCFCGGFVFNHGWAPMNTDGHRY